MLQPGKEVAINISVCDGEGRPLVGILPRIDVSSGTFGEVNDVGNGRYRFLYRMPANRHPQAVILAAKVPGGPPAWTVLPLRSKTVLPVNTDKPNVMVTLTLGNRAYGPVRTDSEGRVTIPVEVGPGDNEALADAVDDFGNRNSRRVVIPIPPSPTLAGFAERGDLAADGEDGSDVFLIAIEQNGRPATNATFVSSKSTGSISATKRVLPGLYRLRFTAPRGLARSEAKLTLSSKQMPDLNRRTFTFQLLPGRPELLTLSAEPSTLTADGKSSAKLSLSVRDKAGNPLERIRPNLSCSRGSVRPLSGAGKGDYVAALTAPSRAVGMLTCVAVLERGDRPPLRSEVNVRLTPPEPGSMKVMAEADRLPMDGKSRSRIRIEIKDRHGEPLEGVPIRGKVPLGTLSSAVEDGLGLYHTVFTAPRGQESTRVRFTFEAGSGDRMVDGQILFLLDGVPPPPPPTPVFVVGPTAGVATNFGRFVGVHFDLQVGVRLPFAADCLYLTLDGGYQFARQTTATNIGGVSLESELETAPIHLSVVMKPLPHSVFTPFLGIGGGPDFVQWSLGIAGARKEKNHLWLWSASAVTGGEYRFGPGALVASFRYLYAVLPFSSKPTPTEGARSSVVKGNVGGMEAGLGYRLFFF